MSAQPTSPTLRRILSGKLCAGCGACAAIAPDAVKMGVSVSGYLRPVQSAELSDAQESRIRQACPGVGLTLEPGDRPDHPLWGPYLSVHSGHATDPALRQNASSGGALSALLVHLLQSGAVDRVVQTGADPALPIANVTVLSERAEEVFQAAGSRYVPSAPLAEIEPLLASTERHAFVGKPCDVAALRALGKTDPRVATRFPYMLSFFCAGVPSLSGAREVLSTMGAPEAQVRQFRFRGNGWPGHAKAMLGDGTERRMSYADSWGGILSRHVQFRCKICPDGTGSFADIVCADAWEADAEGYPTFTDRPGISLVMARTPVGAEVMEQAVTGGRLSLQPFDIDGLESIQPGQTQKRRFTLARTSALRLLLRPVPRYRGFHLARNARRAGLRGLTRNFLGTLRRAIVGHL
ncbi:Coenzyme F420 hydrogenase/dehydrogenase, beta subunit C-terminal domain [Vannielia litorea]|uniref:Coenzyme F420 hydrogenase/dehydrogenase, beta subunit C-terminal domain n=1 Tax=Vannielia litorea TaxID=1217970 RepID=UPI0021BD11BE|nr:Coenzyme F420 hydrogenase/dehydrogenase, beta subunit C-terminal domain [Vannielia litorea]